MRRLPVGIVVGAAMVLIASFLPWQRDDAMKGWPPNEPFGTVEFSASTTWEPTAWTSWVYVKLLDLPNWLVPASALLLALVALMETHPATRVPRLLRVGLCAYGMAHLFALAIGDVIQKRIDLGVGYFATVVAFGVLVVLCLWRRREPISD